MSKALMKDLLNIHNKINANTQKKEKYKQSKVDLGIKEKDLEMAGFKGFYPFFITHLRSAIGKGLFYFVLFYFLKYNQGLLVELDVIVLVVFTFSTILFGFCFDYFFKLYSCSKKYKKLELIKKDEKENNIKIEELKQKYQNLLIDFDITEYQSEKFNDFVNLSEVEKQIIKEYIQFINSDDAKLFNMVKKEDQHNLIGMQNY